MRTKIKYLLFFALILFFNGASYTHGGGPVKFSKKPKNIILFIGDGMGVAQMTAGITVGDRPLNMQKFTYSGFSMTHSADNYITDSAAGGTAIACGVKTNNGMIGVSPDKKIVESVIEIVHRKGFATGIISTSSVTHATPASFVAHNSSRGSYEDIALHFLNGSVDLFLGGGEDHFNKRADGRNLVEELKKQGFKIVYTGDELKTSDSDKIAGLFARLHMPPVSEGRIVSLEDMTRKAIEILSRDKDGFFLMVEGSMIDWGGHANDIDYITSEIIDMDNAIGAALNFADKNRQTLVVVTADHETGGMVLTGGNVAGKKAEAKFATTDHSATMVPILSYGPGAHRFSGIHDNTFFLDTFLNLLRISE